MVVRCRQIREMQQARTVSRMNVVDSVEKRGGGGGQERGLGGGWMDGGQEKKKRAGERGGEHSIYFDPPGATKLRGRCRSFLHSGRHNQ